MLIALGICALLIGGVSVVINLMVGALWFTWARDSIPTDSSLPPVIAASMLPPFTGEYVAPRGLSKAARTPLLAAFKLDGPLNADYLAILDRLLAECGQDVFPNGPTAVSPLADRPADNNGYDRPMRGLAFTTPGGVVAVSRSMASLSNPSTRRIVYETTTLSTSAPAGSMGINNTWPRNYGAFAIDETVAGLNAANPSLTPAQLATIADQLATAKPFNNGLEPRRPLVKLLNLYDNGLLKAEIEREAYFILDDGRSIKASAAPLGIDVAAGRPVALPDAFTPELQGSPTLMIAQSMHCGANLLIALLLMISGFRLLSDNPHGTVLTYRWAILKFTLMALEVVLILAFVASVDPSQRAHRPFDTSRGVWGVSGSVLLQSILPIIALITLKSASTQNYLSARGVSLQFCDWDHWADVRRAVGRSKWAGAFRMAGFAIMALAGVHAVLSILTIPAGDWETFANHATVACLFGWLGRRVIRLKPQAAALAIAMLLSLTWTLPAPAQTKPAADLTPEQRAVRQKATDMLASIDPENEGARTKTVSDVAALGEPAVEPLMAFFAADPTANRNFANAAVEKWRKLKLDTPSFRKTLVDYAPRFQSADGLFVGRTLFDYIGTEPGLLSYWAPVCLHDDSNLSDAAVHNTLKIDPTAAETVRLALERLRDGKSHPHEHAFRTLKKLGAPGRDAVIGLLHDPDRQVRMMSAWALAINHRGDKAAIAALADAAVEALKDSRALGGRPNSGDVMVGVLWLADERGHRSVIDLLNSDRLPEAAQRETVLNVLARDYLPFKGLQGKGPRPKEEWPILQEIARAVVDSDHRNFKPVVTLLTTDDSNQRRMVLQVMAESTYKMPITADELLAKVDVNDETQRRAALEILCRDKDAIKSSAAAKLLQGELVSGSRTVDTSRITKHLRESGPAGRAAMIETLINPKQPRQTAMIIFNGLLEHDNTMSLSEYGYGLRKSLFSPESWGQPAAKAVHAMLSNMSEKELDLDAAALQVLYSDDAVAHAAMAHSLLTVSIGPAARARATAVLQLPPAAAMTPIVVEAAPTAPGQLFGRLSPLSSVTWWLSGAAVVVFLLLAISALIFVTPQDVSGNR